MVAPTGKEGDEVHHDRVDAGAGELFSPGRGFPFGGGDAVVEDFRRERLEIFERPFGDGVDFGSHPAGFGDGDVPDFHCFHGCVP